MTRFIIEDTPIEGVQIIQRQPIGDDRGYLERLFCNDELGSIINSRSIVQINHTMTSKVGTVRGMHYQQPPHAETKLVSCLRGEVFDVVVDLRVGSPTFLHWHGEVLSEDNHRTFCIPEGFAHGFQTLTENCELIYLHTTAYVPDAEAGLSALDPCLDIDWPLSITELSSRDQQHAMLTSDFLGLSV
jgi:dTDP-4-dehydrorhamnose 3,5-epimerase